MIVRVTRFALMLGLVSTVLGCGATRPEPVTVQPDFSYVEATPDARQARHWPVRSDELAEAEAPYRGPDPRIESTDQPTD
jgi:hypothetical protein